VIFKTFDLMISVCEGKDYCRLPLTEYHICLVSIEFASSELHYTYVPHSEAKLHAC